MANLKEEYGEMMLDDYNVDTQNPNPKGKDNEDLIGTERVTIDKKTLKVGPGKTVSTKMLE